MGLGTVSPNSYTDQRVFTINGTSYGRLDLEVAGTLRGSVWADSGGLALDAGGNDIEMYTGSAMRVKINTSGQMGIGENFTPSRHLDIKDSTGANRIVNIRGTGTSGAFLAFLDANTTDDSKCRVGSIGGNSIGLRGDAHHFQNGAGTDRMVIDSSGNANIAGVCTATAFKGDIVPATYHGGRRNMFINGEFMINQRGTRDPMANQNNGANGLGYGGPDHVQLVTNLGAFEAKQANENNSPRSEAGACLLYTSDAADE